MAGISDIVKTKIYFGKITDIYCEDVKIKNSKTLFIVPLNKVFDSNGRPLIYNKNLRERVFHKKVFITENHLTDGSIETKVTIQPEQVKCNGEVEGNDTAR